MTRDELIRDTRALVEEGDRVAQEPALVELRDWLRRSDALLSAAWGSMDRYHLSWLSVGRPSDAPRGRSMSGDEEAAYVRAVATQKTAALRMSLHAIEDQGMPFQGETTADAGPGEPAEPGGPSARTTS